jgi:hypothetical protein
VFTFVIKANWKVRIFGKEIIDVKKT